MTVKDPTCLCINIPTQRAMTFSCNMKVVAACHLDCPQHGITITYEPSMIPVKRQKWATIQEAFLLRRAEGAKVLEKSADRKSALIEWVEWERNEACGVNSP